MKKRLYVFVVFAVQEGDDSQFKKSFLDSHFFDGDANDPKVQYRIKTKFFEFIRGPYFPPPFCVIRPDCTKENMKVYAGAKA